MAFCAAPGGVARGRRRAHGAPRCAVQPPAALYVRAANGEARQSATALLVHDFLTDGRLFAALARERALAGTQLLAVDLRGYGRSPTPDAPYAHAEDLRAVAAARAQAPVHLVGAGLGGVQCLEAAAAAGPRGWVRSVAVLASGLPGHAWSREAFLNVTDARRDRAGAAQDERAEVARWVGKFISNNAAWRETLENGDPAVVARLKDMVREYSGYHFRERDLEIRSDNSEPLRMRLGLVDVPVLAAIGERDTKDFKDIAQEILDGVAQPARKDAVVIPKAGHFPTLENPGEVARILVEFWNSLENDGGRMEGSVAKISDVSD